MRKHHPTDRSVTDQAAQWLATLSDESCNADERREFGRWLTRSNTHVEEFLRISTLTRRLQSAARWPDLDLDDLMATARSESRVIPLLKNEASVRDASLTAREFGASPATLGGRSLIPARFLPRAAAALLVMVIAVFAARQVPGWLGTGQTYTSGFGELRSVTLEDGSIVQLNSQSSFRARFSAAERRIDLTAGEAVFRVTKNPARPFRVHTSDALIQAVGTQFNVNAQSNATVVTVIEGRVAVSPVALGREMASTPTDSIPVLTAGEQLVVHLKGPQLKATQVDPIKVIGWTARRLYFDDTPLAEAVRQFRGYSPLIVRIDDPLLAARRISGTFDSSDPAALVQFLERYGDTAVEKTKDGWHISRLAH
jgi:transmembrane sensor